MESWEPKQAFNISKKTINLMVKIQFAGMYHYPKAHFPYNIWHICHIIVKHYPYIFVTFPIYFRHTSHIFLTHFPGIEKGVGNFFQIKNLNTIIFLGEIWQRFPQSSLILAPFSEKIKKKLPEKRPNLIRKVLGRLIL